MNEPHVLDHSMSNNIDLLKSEFLKGIYEDEPESQHCENVCLISHEPLGDDKITLLCNHTFNYFPLYNEIVQQKLHVNKYISSLRLSISQIKCPYCCKVQNKILPYIQLPKVEKIRGVNYPPKMSMTTHRCSAVLISGKRKGEKCNRPCVSELCSIHINKQCCAKSKCKAVLASGKRKGELCNVYINSGEYCGRHIKKLHM